MVTIQAETGAGWGEPEGKRAPGARFARRGGRREFLLVSGGSLTGALVGSVGCAPPPVHLGHGPREYVAGDYESVLRRWTRSQGLVSISALDSYLTATATYESWDFRWAYVTRYAHDYRLTVDQRHALLKRSLAASQLHHQFYVALYAKKANWSDLKADPPAWIVRLIDDQGSETAPAEIERIRRPGVIELTYFPYTTPWRHVYRLQFPVRTLDGRPTVSPQASWLGLRFAGAQGSQQLVWKIEPREVRRGLAVNSPASQSTGVSSSSTREPPPEERTSTERLRSRR